MLHWMISELQKAEDAGERVWIIGHVLSGWDGYNPLPNPTDLFYQIVDRYSPHVIANTFWGHNHEDQFMIYYANNGSVKNSRTALSTGWIVPSVTPLTNLNSGFRLYEVDTGDFNIYEAYTFFSNVSDYSKLNINSTGPTFQFEYSTRETYGPAAGWDKHAPLNATFWHRVTEAMEHDIQLVTRQNALQGKLSVKSPVCNTTACQHAKICYMRSGSAGLGYLCPQGYVKFSIPLSVQVIMLLICFIDMALCRVLSLRNRNHALSGHLRLICSEPFITIGDDLLQFSPFHFSQVLKAVSIRGNMLQFS